MPVTLRHAAAAFLAVFVFAGQTAPVRAQDLGEIMIRLDRLEAENRRLTGQLEQAQNLARRLDDQLKRFQQDVDLRFQDQAGRPGAPRAAAPARPRRDDAFDPNAQPAAPGAPLVLGATPPSPPLPNAAAAPRVVGATPTSPSSPPLPNAAAAPPAAPAPGTPLPPSAPPANAQEAYNQARATVQRGEYELGETQLRDFLRVYPRDGRAAAATFQLGETFFRRSRHREAAEQYLEVSTKYQKSQLAPESLLKLSMSLRSLGEKEQACGTLAEVGRRYPQVNDNLKRAVERELSRAQC